MVFRTFLILLAAGLLGAGMYAQDSTEKPAAQAKPEPTDYVEATSELFREIDKVIDSVTLTDADVQSWIDERESFRGAMQADAEYLKLGATNLKQAFDHAIASAAFKKWAKNAGLTGEDWLRKGFRVLTLDYRRRTLAAAPDQKKELAAQRKRVEAEKQTLSTNEYSQAIATLDAADTLVQGLEDAAKALPEATEAETKALKAHAGKLG